MQTTREAIVQSAIPANVSSEDIIKKLHDYEFVIRLSPKVQTVKPTGIESQSFLKNDLGYKSWFEVTEIVPIIGTISFFAGFDDRTDGYDCKIYAQAGLVMHLSARAKDNTFTETCHFRGNWFLMPYIVWQFSRVHRQIHPILFKRIKAENGLEDS